MLLVKMPLINLSILRSRVDVSPPPGPVSAWELGGSRVIGGAGLVGSGGGGDSRGGSQGGWDG